jgi:hypothetical protein
MAKVNRNYCKPDAEMRPVYAPAVFRYNGKDYWHPEKEDFALVGYLPLSPDWPVDPPQGKHYERTDKIESDGADGYRWTYRLVDNPPPPPRVFVTADLVEALMAEGIWTDVRSWIETQGLLDLVLATNEFDETNETFQAGKTALQTALGWTDEEVEELLAKCVKEGV